MVCGELQAGIVELRGRAAGMACGPGPWQGAGMSEIVNLNRARKLRDRDAAARQAAENRVVHGQTRAQRLALEQAAQRRAALLDGARLEEGAGPKDGAAGGPASGRGPAEG